MVSMTGQELHTFSCPCTLHRLGRKCLDREKMGCSRLSFRKIVISTFIDLVASVTLS